MIIFFNKWDFRRFESFDGRMKIILLLFLQNDLSRMINNSNVVIAFI